MASLSGQVIGGYRLLDLIGQGGMASVYRAQRLGDGRFLAFKIITPVVAQHEQFVKRFEREVQVVSRLHHPRIVPVVHYGETDGRAFLVMPYLSGGSLSDRIVRGGISASEGARILNHVASALTYAHERGIVHRDVKPSNILLDGEGNAFLADFGLAQIADASLSLTGSALIGTPAYISPEQARGDRVDARSDQYSLGIVLFQVSTGTLPYDADTPIGVLMKHLNEPLPRPRDVSPTVPLTVERVILKATAKDPTDRFRSVAEMNAAFQAAVAYTLDPTHTSAPPLIPLPPSATQSMPGLARPSRERSRPWWIAAAAMLLVALFGTVMTASAALTGWPFSLGTATDDASRAASPAQLTEMASTIDRLSTQIAASGVQEADVRRAVEQTLTAMEADSSDAAALGASDGASSPTMTPTPTLPGGYAAATATNKPAATSTHSSGGGPTSTKASPNPTSTSASPPTDEPPPPPTDEPPPPPTDEPPPPPTDPPPAPTDEPAPTKTPKPPKPTKTPKP
jgi:serine/threonine-protein kinase